MTGTKKGARAMWDYNRRQKLINSGLASAWTPKRTIDEAIRRAGI